LIFVLKNAKESDISSTHDKRYSDFAIDDTASIDKIIIKEANGGKAVLTKVGDDKWMVNGKHEARIDAIHTIFVTAKRVSVKSEVPKSATKTVITQMSVSYKRVEYFSKGILLKTWFVGTSTSDHYGTYMLLEKPEVGKSSEPYIMEIKGFFGHLSSRFFTDEKEWRNAVIYKMEPNQISSVSIKNNEIPEYSFKIEVKGKNQFEMYDHENKKVSGFDTVSVRSYLLNFRKIAFETFNRGVLSEKQEDSLRKAIPFAEFTVVDNFGNFTTLKTYRKTPTEEQKNLDGKSYQWDIERLYAIIPTGEVVVMQYRTLDKIWRAILNFKE
jgi:hypothetical protein